MPISPYIAALRKRVGSTRLLMPSVTAIIYGENGEILLVKQRDGEVWSTPGGSIEPDERPVDAVIRETREETGLEVSPIRIIGAFGGPEFVVRYPNDDEVQYVMTVYECAIISGEIAQSTDETTAARFVAPDEITALQMPEWTKEVLPLCYDAFLRRSGNSLSPVVDIESKQQRK